MFFFKILWITTVFSHMDFLFYFFIFLKFFLLILFFKYWDNWEISFIIKTKTLLIATVFIGIFFMIFFEIIVLILVFNIELVKNFSYNMWEKHCNFPHKLLWIAIVFFPTWFFFSFFYVFFFLIFFSKIIFVDFIFLILNWLEFNHVIKLNHMGKAL